MIRTRIVKDVTGTIDLCETYSTDGYKLLQTETNFVYGSSVVDVIEGYDINGKPYSRYTYRETAELADDESEVKTDAE